MIGIVVLAADLVARVEHRDTAEREHAGVQHQVQPQRLFELFVVFLIPGTFDAAERGCRPAEAGVAEAGIVIVKFAAGRAAGKAAGQIIIQILLMRYLAHTELPEEGIVQPPADVVVAAQIIEESIFFWQDKDLAELVPQQADITGGHRVPDAGHGGDIVQQMALRPVHRAEIGHDL